MSAALQKFMALRRQYRGLVPKRRMTFERYRLISRAASLEVCRQIATIENALNGGKHDVSILDQMGGEVQSALVQAGATFKR
jgi:hypothetical protein